MLIPTAGGGEVPSAVAAASEVGPGGEKGKDWDARRALFTGTAGVCWGTLMGATMVLEGGKEGAIGGREALFHASIIPKLPRASAG